MHLLPYFNSTRALTACTAQRLALPAWGGSVESPSKRDSAEAKKKLKKRGAYPESGARCVRRTHRTPASGTEASRHGRIDNIMAHDANFRN